MFRKKIALVIAMVLLMTQVISVGNISFAASSNNSIKNSRIVAVGDDPLDLANAPVLKIQENDAGEFNNTTQTFQLHVNNGEWISGYETEIKNNVNDSLGGGNYSFDMDATRIDSDTVELTCGNIQNQSSSKLTMEIPLLAKNFEEGAVQVVIDGNGSEICDGTFTFVTAFEKSATLTMGEVVEFYPNDDRSCTIGNIVLEEDSAGSMFNELGEYAEIQFILKSDQVEWYRNPTDILQYGGLSVPSVSWTREISSDGKTLNMNVDFYELSEIKGGMSIKNAAIYANDYTENESVTMDVIINDEIHIEDITIAEMIVSSSKLSSLGLQVIDSSEFSPDVFSYDYQLPYDDDSLTFWPETFDPEATIYINDVLHNPSYSPSKIKFDYGISEVEIRVESDAETLIYTLDVERIDYGSNILTSLNVDSGILEPSFHPSVLTYSVDLPSDVSELSISATPIDYELVGSIGNRSYNWGDEQLVSVEYGSNQVYIDVVDESYSRKRYTLNINRFDDAVSSGTFNTMSKVINFQDDYVPAIFNAPVMRIEEVQLGELQDAQVFRLRMGGSNYQWDGSADSDLNKYFSEEIKSSDYEIDFNLLSDTVMEVDLLITNNNRSNKIALEIPVLMDVITEGNGFLEIQALDSGISAGYYQFGTVKYPEFDAYFEDVVEYSMDEEYVELSDLIIEELVVNSFEPYEADGEDGKFFLSLLNINLGVPIDIGYYESPEIYINDELVDYSLVLDDFINEVGYMIDYDLQDNVLHTVRFSGLKLRNVDGSLGYNYIMIESDSNMYARNLLSSKPTENQDFGYEISIDSVVDFPLENYEPLSTVTLDAIRISENELRGLDVSGELELEIFSDYVELNTDKVTIECLGGFEGTTDVLMTTNDNITEFNGITRSTDEPGEIIIRNLVLNVLDGMDEDEIFIRFDGSMLLLDEDMQVANYGVEYGQTVSSGEVVYFTEDQIAEIPPISIEETVPESILLTRRLTFELMTEGFEFASNEAHIDFSGGFSGCEISENEKPIFSSGTKFDLSGVGENSINDIGTLTLENLGIKALSYAEAGPVMLKIRGTAIDTDYTIKIADYNTDNFKLSVLNIEGFKLSPSFNPNIYEYQSDIPGDEEALHLHIMPANRNLVVTANGNAVDNKLWSTGVDIRLTDVISTNIKSETEEGQPYVINLNKTEDYEETVVLNSDIRKSVTVSKQYNMNLKTAPILNLSEIDRIADDQMSFQLTLDNAIWEPADAEIIKQYMLDQVNNEVKYNVEVYYLNEQILTVILSDLVHASEKERLSIDIPLIATALYEGDMTVRINSVSNSLKDKILTFGTVVYPSILASSNGKAILNNDGTITIPEVRIEENVIGSFAFYDGFHLDMRNRYNGVGKHYWVKEGGFKKGLVLDGEGIFVANSIYEYEVNSEYDGKGSLSVKNFVVERNSDYNNPPLEFLFAPYQRTGDGYSEIIKIEDYNNAPVLLKNIKTNGNIISGFDPNRIDYLITCGNKMTEPPFITAEPVDPNATVYIVQASEFGDATQIKVVSADQKMAQIHEIAMVKREEISEIPNEPINMGLGNNTNIEIADTVDPTNSESVLELEVPDTLEKPTVTLPVKTEGDKIIAILPAMNITQKSGAESKASLRIPAGIKVTANQDTNWDGTLELPKVKKDASVSFNGKTERVIEVGFEGESLIFDQAIRLEIPGMAGKEVGYIDSSGNFVKIDKVLSADNQATANAEIATGKEAKINSDSDLVIWTKHFTEFVAYTPSVTDTSTTTVSTSSGGGGGGGGASASVTLRPQKKTVTGAGELKLTIVPNTVRQDIVLKLKTIKTIYTHLNDNQEILGSIYTISKNVDDPLLKPMHLEFRMYNKYLDIDEGNVSLYWFDETEKTWNEIENVEQKNGRSYFLIEGEYNEMGRYAVVKTLPSTVLETAETVETVETIIPEDFSIGYLDLQSHWSKDNVKKLLELKAVSGYPDGTFKPDASITRAEFVTVLVKAFGFTGSSTVTFNDIKDHWSRDMIQIAHANGIANGYEDGTFRPDAPITREQMALMITSSLSFIDQSEKIDFEDLDEISEWANPAVVKAVNAKILNGYPDGTFKPQKLASRAEAVTVIVNAIK